MSLKYKIIYDAIWGEETQITDEIVEYYQKNPRDLDLILDKEHFYGRFIKLVFFLGIVLTVLSGTLKFYFEDYWSEFISDVILDVFSEMGIAMFGGAITTFLLEKLNQKQYERNISLRQEIIARINQSQNNVTDDTI
ncbi:MAG: hypothetical protein ACK5RG_10995 [Cyclobacteriaceae bacterium]|jgi:hypothetical protein|nr:hypothetical protein [Flammeovirgaceae bacterium]